MFVNHVKSNFEYILQMLHVIIVLKCSTALCMWMDNLYNIHFISLKIPASFFYLGPFGQSLRYSLSPGSQEFYRARLGNFSTHRTFKTKPRGWVFLPWNLPQHRIISYLHHQRRWAPLLASSLCLIYVFDLFHSYLKYWLYEYFLLYYLYDELI